MTYIKLSEIQFDQPIYRFLSIERFKEMCAMKQNVLVRPKLWDDPFENFLFNAIGRNSNGEHFSFGYRNDFYGQCWTNHDETDAMWRIYSPNKDGVRIQSTPRKLMDRLYASRSQTKFRDLECAIGTVSYLSTDDLYAILKDGEKVRSMAFDASGKGQFESFLIKRTAFSHENEVRLLFHDTEMVHKNDDVYRYSIDPRADLDGVLLDPRLKTDEVHRLKAEFCDVGLGDHCAVTPSFLYRLPQLYASLETEPNP